MRTDFLGEYDENEVPRDFHAPVRVDEKNDAIVGDDNFVMLRYAFTTETVPKGFARRRAEFLCRMANGEIMVDGGTVYLRTAKQYQQGRFLVTYDPVGAEVVRMDLTPGPIVPLETVKRGLVFAVEKGTSNDGAIFFPKGITKTEMKKYETLTKRLGKFVAKLHEKYNGEDGEK